MCFIRTFVHQRGIRECTPLHISPKYVSPDLHTVLTVVNDVYVISVAFAHVQVSSSGRYAQICGRDNAISGFHISPLGGGRTPRARRGCIYCRVDSLTKRLDTTR